MGTPAYNASAEPTNDVAIRLGVAVVAAMVCAVSPARADEHPVPRLMVGAAGIAAAESMSINNVDGISDEQLPSIGVGGRLGIRVTSSFLVRLEYERLFVRMGRLVSWGSAPYASPLDDGRLQLAWLQEYRRYVHLFFGAAFGYRSMTIDGAANSPGPGTDLVYHLPGHGPVVAGTFGFLMAPDESVSTRGYLLPTLSVGVSWMRAEDVSVSQYGFLSVRNITRLDVPQYFLELAVEFGLDLALTR